MSQCNNFKAICEKWNGKLLNDAVMNESSVIAEKIQTEKAE